ncbi:MAG: hypothetical protein KKA60_13050 [Proteobacteria bacterium]|nr:hypothetical protein [Pseudomonadota bacterium]
MDSISLGNGLQGPFRGAMDEQEGMRDSKYRISRIFSRRGIACPDEKEPSGPAGSAAIHLT